MQERFNTLFNDLGSIDESAYPAAIEEIKRLVNNRLLLATGILAPPLDLKPKANTCVHKETEVKTPSMSLPSFMNITELTLAMSLQIMTNDLHFSNIYMTCKISINTLAPPLF